ncbi:hypothetical protein ALI22I_32145 [Saccharothrix sp. ALI-22-I]|uniref:hypothetical protein n=1 Tax=Saccharothrix sp. ALI-22-I TaxID=1933778 RepID=UPI00097C0F6E|nr:hypothetical protein [Saccharothrix sp. ALI-22-I]ONI85084.1 hypothetical protein ALI22I_32145 [Saccharothrix sp. ALI-22-I]
MNYGPTCGDDPFGLHAQFERQWAEFADGPTMADLLTDLDDFRNEAAGPDVVSALHESRAERDADSAEPWRR